MPWKNNNGDVSETRPTRVRLPEADTRTAEAVTDEVLAEAGWYWEEPVVVVPEVTVEVPVETPQDPPYFTSSYYTIESDSTGSTYDYTTQT